MRIYATENSDYIYVLGKEMEYCIFNKQGMSFAGIWDDSEEAFSWGQDEEGRDRLISIDEEKGEIDITWGDIGEWGRIILIHDQEEQVIKCTDGSTLYTCYRDVILHDDGKGYIMAGRMWFEDEYYLMEDGGRLYRDENSYRIEYKSGHNATIESSDVA